MTLKAAMLGLIEDNKPPMSSDSHWQHVTYKPNKLCQSDLVSGL